MFHCHFSSERDSKLHKSRKVTGSTAVFLQCRGRAPGWGCMALPGAVSEVTGGWSMLALGLQQDLSYRDPLERSQNLPVDLALESSC